MRHNKSFKYFFQVFQRVYLWYYNIFRLNLFFQFFFPLYRQIKKEENITFWVSTKSSNEYYNIKYEQYYVCIKWITLVVVVVKGSSNIWSLLSYKLSISWQVITNWFHRIFYYSLIMITKCNKSIIVYYLFYVEVILKYYKPPVLKYSKF